MRNITFANCFFVTVNSDGTSRIDFKVGGLLDDPNGEQPVTATVFMPTDELASLGQTIVCQVAAHNERNHKSM